MDDSLYMKRALEIAALGRGRVSPNPMVGCVIVVDNEIIGEGFHQYYGGAHAEVNAIEAVSDPSLLTQSTLYVTLEPCSHWGKTPPCADLIVNTKIPKVVICNTDSNPVVSGKGIQKLKDVGVEVVSGVLDDLGRELNVRFFTYMEKKRPYIILKWAQTKDGFIARKDYSSKWISNSLSRRLVHKWRSEEAAVMVGKNTALHDNPKLNVREWVGDNPMRIVIDDKLSLSKDLFLFDNSQTTLCYNGRLEEAQEYTQYVKINFNEDPLDQILKDLHLRKVMSVIVEGGANLLNQFIELNLWDEIRCFESDQVFLEGIKAPLFDGIIIEEEEILGNSLKIYYPK